MEYRRLGQAGVKVSRLCFGAGVRGPLDEASFVQSLERAMELGCNFIDCANGYGKGQSETILGRVIKGKRDDLVITSKVWSRIGPGPNDQGLSRYHIMREVERSLKKLQTDRIDIYYEQVIQTLATLAQARGATPAQMAIAWLLDHPEVTAPIVGVDRPEYVDEVFGALDIQLTPEERQALDRISQWDEPRHYL